jgi:transcriptional regulator with XRE-family HTH domain
MAKQQRGGRWLREARAAGKIIAAARERRGINRLQLAKLACVDQGTLWLFENGQRANIAAATFMSICRVLNLDPYETWWGERPGPKKPGSDEISSGEHPALPSASDK